MIPIHHRFRLGSFDCVALNDGQFTYPAEQYFPSAPRDVVDRVLADEGLQAEAIPSPYTCLFVDTGSMRVLVDTGAGPLTPDLGRLPEALDAAGIEATAIDVVILTHGHPDHIGGLTRGGALAFPGARHVIARDEWAYWTEEANLVAVPELFSAVARANLAPLAGHVDLVDGDTEIVPGVRIVPAPGHTVGHCGVSVTSGSENLLYVSDAVMHPLHLAHPDWAIGFDADPEQALASRRLLFDHAATNGSLVLAYHFHPFPSLGRVARGSVGWTWQPVAGED